MADLEAIFENQKAGVRTGWRHPLPLDTPKKIGRVASQADWWIPDEMISGFHATITWNGKTLSILERNPPPTNRIYYDSQPVAQCEVPPGASFVIGNTVFTLHGDAELDPPNWADATVPAVAIASRGELRKLPFDTPATTLRALEQVADVLRLATDEDVLLNSMLHVLLNALPRSDVAAVVKVLPESTDGDPRAVVTSQAERMSGVSDRFTPSRRLADKAIRRERRSIVHAWASGVLESSSMTVGADPRPGTPWAIATPFQDSSNMGIYVAGRLPREPEVHEGKLRDRELTDAQKIIELIASLIESTRKSHDLERQLTLYRRFLPRRLWSETDRGKLDAILAPRQTDVTVLFVDLRGSCRFAEGGNTNLSELWQQLSAALDDMSQTITREDGIVAGFQGDAVMAFWGWPDPQPDQVDRAARAALRLRERFDRDGWWSQFSVGIGIANGPAVAGRLGAHDLAKVDVFGPTVNLASRLEGMTKSFGARILIDEPSAQALAKSDPQRVRFRTRRLAPVRPAGMTSAVTPSELLPPENAPGAPMKEAVRRSWEEAMGWFTQGQWRQARERLQQFFAKDPFAQLVLATMGNSPAPQQDGGAVIIMTSK